VYGQHLRCMPVADGGLIVQLVSGLTYPYDSRGTAIRMMLAGGPMLQRAAN
jgi:hypothetical protein